jgi:hypothetical protein
MIYVVIAFMAVVLVITMIRLRRGGPGPQVNWIPRALRPRTNRFFTGRGWQAPYDAEGNRNPQRGI